MTDERFPGYRDHLEAGYAGQIAESGQMSWEDAVEKASEDTGRLLPKGVATPDNYLFTAVDGDTEVGLVWINLVTKSDGIHGFVYDIEVHETARRQGYGRAIMLAAEQVAREHGASSMRLNVFGYNVAARRLYEEIGYETTSMQMLKRF